MFYAREALVITLLTLSACRGESEVEEDRFEEIGVRKASLASTSQDQVVNPGDDLQSRSLRQPPNKPLAHEPIVFPGNSEYSGEEESQGESEIPLWLLRELSNEGDIEKIFKDHVKNAKIVTTAGGSKVLVHSDGGFVQGNSKGVVPIEIVAIPSPGEQGRNHVTRFSPLASPVASQHAEVFPQNPRRFSLPGPRISFKNLPEVEVENNRVVGPGPVKLTQPAGCAPETRTVEVPVPPGNTRSLVLPKCVRLMQCGGCCGSSALACEPTEEVPMEVSVNLLEYNVSTGGLAYKSTEKIILQSHTKCACNCKTKEHHCNATLHRYDKGECRCHCRNQEEQSQCRRQQHKIWNHQTCSCNCRTVKECNSGFEQDPLNCECVPIQVAARRRTRRLRRRNSSQSTQG